MDSFEQFRLFRIKHAEMIGMGIPVYNCQCVITPITKDTTMTQEAKPVPHVHAKLIKEWADDPLHPWQFNRTGKWKPCCVVNGPEWHTNAEYRRKPRWFDMEQLWIARGKPPVEVFEQRLERWVETSIPRWKDESEYRFKEVSRHAALKAEWEAKGRPARQYKFIPTGDTEWKDVSIDCHGWTGECDYRIKPTPHPDIDVLRALAEDVSLAMEISGAGSGWVSFDLSKVRLRIKQ